MTKVFDTLDYWFNGSLNKTPKSRTATGMRASSTQRTATRPKQRQKNLQAGVKAMQGKGPAQVMVKISGASKGCDRAQAHANYVGRNGEVEIENEAGDTFAGDAQKALLKTWEAMGMPAQADEGKRREALHIVFSMPKGTNATAVKNATRNLVKEEFAGHKYFMAQHTDTDQPHCHVLLCITDDKGARLNPRKTDLHNWRVAFVNKLAEQGVHATASPRVARPNLRKTHSQARLHIDKRKARSNSKTQPNKAPAR